MCACVPSTSVRAVVVAASAGIESSTDALLCRDLMLGAGPLFGAGCLAGRWPGRSRLRMRGFHVQILDFKALYFRFRCIPGQIALLNLLEKQGKVASNLRPVKAVGVLHELLEYGVPCPVLTFGCFQDGGQVSLHELRDG